MNAPASPYLLKPWLQHYGDHIPLQLMPPMARNLADMASAAAQ